VTANNAAAIYVWLLRSDTPHLKKLSLILFH